MFGVNREGNGAVFDRGVSNLQYAYDEYNESRDTEYTRIYYSLYGDC